MTKEKFYCVRCNQMMAETEFYKTKNLETYPTGYFSKCKKCATAHIDPWDTETAKPLLQELDIPLVKDKWNKILEREMSKKGAKTSGMGVMGKYISAMQLMPYKGKRWADTELIENELLDKKRDALKTQGFGDEEIAEILSSDTTPDRIEFVESSSSFANKLTTSISVSTDSSGTDNSLVVTTAEDSDFSLEEDEEDADILNNLTEEDITYLKLKWGKNYRPHEWVTMEQLYEDMMNSYDIQTAGHKDYLKKICKASLKADQLIDCGDIDSFQKLTKVYDQMMKSSKFTAAQNKEENGEYVDSIAELVAICEREGFIPKYYTDGPQDKIDRIITDTYQYTYNLITNELGLGNLIENAVKSLEDERERIKSAQGTDGGNYEFDEEDELFDYAKKELQDKDFIDFQAFEEELEELEEDEE